MCGGGNPVSDLVDTAGDLGQGVIDTAKDTGKAIDQGIRDNVPGGWTTAALLAAGAYYSDGAWLSAEGTPVEAVPEATAAPEVAAAPEAVAAPEAAATSPAETLYPNQSDGTGLKMTSKTTGEGLTMDSITGGTPNLEAMGGGQGLTVAEGSALGESSSFINDAANALPGATGMVSEAGVTAADAMPALGDPNSFVNGGTQGSGGMDWQSVAQGVLAGKAIGTLLTQLTQPAQSPVAVASNDPLQTEVAAGARSGINAVGGTSGSIQGVADTLLTKKAAGSSGTLLGG